MEYNFKLILGARGNMSLDGFCDHTAMIPDDELLQHFKEGERLGDEVPAGVDDLDRVLLD